MGKIVARKETGNLFFDFRYLGKRCREQTTLADTAANRKKLQKVLPSSDVYRCRNGRLAMPRHGGANTAQQQEYGDAFQQSWQALQVNKAVDQGE